MAEEEYEEYEEEVEEVEDSNAGGEQNQAKEGEPQNKNTNIIGQPKAEDEKSSNSKKSGGSKVSKSKNSNKKQASNANTNSNNEKRKTTKSNKTKNTNDNKNENNNENAYKIPTPEQVVSTRAYLEQTVTSVIQEALLELARRRPSNPLEFVGNYILDKAKKNK